MSGRAPKNVTETALDTSLSRPPLTRAAQSGYIYGQETANESLS
jgi:hypothetical protein